MKAYLILYSFLFLVSNAFSQETNFKTIEYFKNDTLSLALDYFSPNNERGNPTPLFIFVHGGGFSGGSRESGHEICKFLSENGIASASISYTLYMKGKSFSCDGILSEKMKAIQLASNQFLLATQYFIDNADEFNIIKNKIYAAGSSAGAETVLQAVYGNRSLAKYFKLTLPTNFRYAGLISGAGAIADINNVNPSTQIPALFFHGTCDKLVPYATAPHHYCNGDAPGWLMLFGAHTIHQKLVNELNESSYLVTYIGGGHEYAGKPFSEEKETILGFINQTIKKEKIQVHKLVETGKTCDMDTPSSN